MGSSPRSPSSRRPTHSSSRAATTTRCHSGPTSSTRRGTTRSHSTAPSPSWSTTRWAPPRRHQRRRHLRGRNTPGAPTAPWPEDLLRGRVQLRGNRLPSALLRHRHLHPLRRHGDGVHPPQVPRRQWLVGVPPAPPLRRGERHLGGAASAPGHAGAGHRLRGGPGRLRLRHRGGVRHRLQRRPARERHQGLRRDERLLPVRHLRAENRVHEPREWHHLPGPTGPPQLQTWKAPATGTYRVTAIGASGATATNATNARGGCGASISGEFTFQKDDVVRILVGQKGTAAALSAGGGGGSFVVGAGNTPLLIAGGGGGLRAGATVNGRPGALTEAGSAGSVSASHVSGFVAGGVGGQGGARVASYGAGGGGWLGNGAADGNYGLGGASFQNGASGGGGTSCGVAAPGGYGGGGAGNGCYGAGGGGGYSGGGGGRVGGGGGSWNTGTRPSNTSDVCTPSGHGQVTLEFVHPSPASGTR